MTRLYEHLPGISCDYVIGVRPEKGTWSPFFIALPRQEKSAVNPSLLYEPAGLIPVSGMLFQSGESQSDNGKWLILYAPNAATPT